MPEGLMVQARHVPTLMAIQAKTPFTSPGLSLGPPRLLQEELDMSQTAESDLLKIREEEFESKSGSDNIEGASGEEQDADQRARKKRYHRHTQHQIQEMEMFFKECPHPDDKQRQELSKRLCLEPRQIKFWFQNKRTQMKTHQERQENIALRAENEKLRMENLQYQQALNNASCPNCGGPAAIGEMSFDEQQLRIDNARLREEVDRISAIAAKYLGKPVPSLVPPLSALPGPTLEFSSAGNLRDFNGTSGSGEVLSRPVGLTESEKPVVVELAVAAMEELVRMAQLGEPLWTSHFEGGYEILSDEEYIRTFPQGIGPRPYGLKAEASRESGHVIMNAINLVEALMDVNQWSSMFSCIVSRAFTVEVFSTGVAGNYNGALQVMYAEFQVPSPLVPTRENYFLRYCKQHSDGVWAVVDVSLDSLRGNPPPSMLRCRRRPSGCLIQEMPNGYSKVTWVEHVEVDERAVHRIYHQLVSSGMGFGAKRWLATLERQCERLASMLACNIPARDLGVISNSEGRKSMLKLAERMTNSFCAGVSASSAHTWTTLSGSGAEDVRVMTRKSIDDPGRPPGIVLSAATSFWLPASPMRVFEFLRDENLRNEWDILSNGGLVQEMAHIANGQDPGNCVSLLRVNNVNSNQSNMLILQESSIDVSSSFVIYAPVDIVAVNVVLNGGDPDYVALLPSGFAILPDGPQLRSGANIISEKISGGSLLTVAFQILVDSVPTAKLSLGSVATVNSLISCTVERIKAALNCENA
eukprot:Gb_16030 [translate_table: standard]